MARVSKKSLTLTVLFTYYMEGLEEEKEEKIIDGMFKKTSLGRMVGLKPEEKTKKEKQKENNIHGH